MRSILIPDDELEREALAADPAAGVPADAVSLWDIDPSDGSPALLPGWYMPPPVGGPRRHPRGRRRVVYLLITAFALINAAGLCSTYGHVVIA